MNAATLKAHALAVNLAVHGADVTVRRAAPAAALSSRGVWLTALVNEQGPAPSEWQKFRTRGLMALPRSAAAVAALAAGYGLTAAAVPWLERDDVIEAPPATGGAAVRWRVDGIDQYDADHIRVILREDITT